MGGLTTLSHSTVPCEFCNLDEIDEFKFGPLFQIDGIVAHYYCVLFANKVQQRGEDHEGLLGFLVSDIKVEINRVKKILCCYCNKPRASVNCAGKKCKKAFHFPCGIKRGSLHQFKDSFKSYCYEHRPIQDIPEEAIKLAEENEAPCAICYDTVDYRSVTDTIWASCCSTTWYHRDCLQKHALSSGYFFKCAICNNNSKFNNWVKEYGIFIPQKDASWELEPDAFGELSHQYSQCDAIDCKCPRGREGDISNTIWEIILCSSCGSQGMHIACGQLKFHKPLWHCDLCKAVIAKVRSQRINRSVKTTSDSSSDSQRKNDQLERLSDGDRPTSSGSEAISTESTGNEAKPKKIRGSGYVKKRKRTDAEDGEKPVKRKYKRRGCPPGKRVKADTEQVSAKGSKLNRDLGALLKKDLVIENNINEANGVEESVEATEEPNPAEAEDSDDPDDYFPLEEIARRKKIEEEGLEVIDLTAAPSITEEEITSVMEVYRNYQLTDVKYRVKKEIVVISDDEADNSDVEVVLDGKESQATGTREPQNVSNCLASTTYNSNNWYKRASSELNISLNLKFQVGINDLPSETNENPVMESVVVTEETKRTDWKKCETNRETVRVRDGLIMTQKPHKLLTNSVDSADVRNAICVSDERNEIGRTLATSLAAIEASQDWASDINIFSGRNHVEQDSDKLIERCLTLQNNSKSERWKSTNGMGKSGSRTSGSSDRESGNEDDDIEVIEVVKGRSNGIRTSNGQRSPEKCSGSEEDIIEIE